MAVCGFFFGWGRLLHTWHMEIPRLGVKSELQLPATATATWDPSHICNRHHSSQPCQIPKPLSGGRDRTRIFRDTSRIRFHRVTRGTPTRAICFQVFETRLSKAKEERCFESCDTLSSLQKMQQPRYTTCPPVTSFPCPMPRPERVTIIMRTWGLQKGDRRGGPGREQEEGVQNNAFPLPPPQDTSYRGQLTSKVMSQLKVK